MDAKRAAVHSSKYFLITTLFAVVGLGLVAVGAFLSQPALEAQTPQAVLSALIPGLVLAVLGLAVYRFGKAWALYKTLTAANEEALADTFDTQRVKSDIVSVVDDRLSDMQTELQSANRELRKLREDEPYDFSKSSTSTSGTGSSSTTGSAGAAESTGSSESIESETEFEPAQPTTDSGAEK